MIDKINQERKGHIITVEDPIEFIHRHQSCIVNQREVGTDTKSFANALKYALREDPDVILVGEMRDLETIAAALTIAETGHLALATLHTNSAAESINRIIDVFPSHQQSQVRAQLAFVLEGVVTQTLLPKAKGRGRVDGGRDHGGHAGDPRADPRRQDPPDLLGDAGRQEVRHADDERRALPALHEPRSDRRRSACACRSDPNEFLRMIGRDADRGPGRSRTADGRGERRADRAALSRHGASTAAPRRSHHADVRIHRPQRRAARSRRASSTSPAEDDVIAYLRKNRLILVSVREAPKQISFSLRRQRIKTRDIVIFTRQFATMINAGLPLVQALDILAAADREQGAARTSPRRWCSTSSPATRWPTRSRKHPKAFTDLYVNMVAAGEAGGILDTILLRLATFLEKNDALVRKVKGAMIYPGVIISVAVHRDRGAAHLRDPDLPEHVRLGRHGAAAADPDRDRRCRTS